MFLNRENKYAFLNTEVTVSTPSLSYKYSTHLVPVDGIGRWRRLEVGRKDQMEEVGKISVRNSPCVPILPGAASAWSSTTENVQKGGQRGETPL